MASPIQELLSRSEVGVTIGNFDGLHLGHQALFERLDRTLAERSAVSRKPPLKVLLSFWPHPRQVLNGVKRSQVVDHPELYTLTTVRQKLSLLADNEFSICYLLRFSKSFAELTPEAFLRDYLVQPLHPSVVVIGDDWAFGRDRSGNIGMLTEFGARNGFQVEVVSGFNLNGRRVSSTAVKNALAAAKFDELEELLGRRYALHGRVRGGEKLGRTLGFPTANLEFRALLLPPDGIYAGFAHLDGARIPAAIYIGHRPSFGGKKRVVEVHLMDGRSYDIYGARLSVEFIQKVRDDCRFATHEELIAAIQADVAEARRILSNTKR
ncbi:MAG: riboflavin biosynthesis protein RibF [Bdellovibrionota bacterium]